MLRPIALSLVFATAVSAQTTPIARTPDGQPDIQGYWTEAPGGPDAVNVETGFQTADSLRVQGWTEARLAARVPVSAIIDAPGGRIPYQPWAEKRHQEIFHRYGGDEITGRPQTVRDVSSELLCVIGTPRLMFFADFQITQTPNLIVMQWERSSDFRIIPLTNTAPLPAAVKLHNGDSRGHWEGNTLVVEGRNFNEHGWYDTYGNFHSSDLRIEERYTFAGNRMYYDVTSQDPRVFAAPWTAHVEFARRAEPDEPWETACYEGEKDVEHIIGRKKP